MYEQNVEFYKDVEETKYDVHLFARKMLCNRWSGTSVLRFLAFGAKKKSEREAILGNLNSEYPEWRSELAWTNLLWKLG